MQIVRNGMVVQTVQIVRNADAAEVETFDEPDISKWAATEKKGVFIVVEGDDDDNDGDDDYHLTADMSLATIHPAPPPRPSLNTATPTATATATVKPMSEKKATKKLAKKLGRAPDAAEVKAYMLKMAKKKKKKEEKKRKEKQMQPLPAPPGAPPARPDSDDADADYELPSPVERRHAHEAPEYAVTGLPTPPARHDTVSDSDADADYTDADYADADYELPSSPVEGGQAHEAPEYAVTGPDAATYGSLDTVSNGHANGFEGDFSDSDVDGDTDDSALDL